jgi:hypothetical protein
MAARKQKMGDIGRGQGKIQLLRKCPWGPTSSIYAHLLLFTTSNKAIRV